MRQVYRSKSALVLGWVWVVFVAFNVLDLIVRYSGKPSMVALAVLAVLTVVVYAIALRPATVFTEDGLLGRNPAALDVRAVGGGQRRDGLSLDQRRLRRQSGCCGCGRR